MKPFFFAVSKSRSKLGMPSSIRQVVLQNKKRSYTIQPLHNFIERTGESSGTAPTGIEVTTKTLEKTPGSRMEAVKHLEEGPLTYF